MGFQLGGEAAAGALFPGAKSGHLALGLPALGCFGTEERPLELDSPQAASHLPGLVH